MIQSENEHCLIHSIHPYQILLSSLLRKPNIDQNCGTKNECLNIMNLIREAAIGRSHTAVPQSKPFAGRGWILAWGSVSVSCEFADRRVLARFGFESG